MARVKKFKGKTIEELMKMDPDTYMGLLTSRKRRTYKRINQNPKYKKLVNKVREIKQKSLDKGTSDKPIKTRVRDAVILPEWLGLYFAVHDGLNYIPVKITISRLGHTLGDFSHTTHRVVHSGPGVGATRGSKFVPLK